MSAADMGAYNSGVRKSVLLLIPLLFSACGPAAQASPIATASAPSPSSTPSPTQISLPPGLNPLTGQPVADPEMLKIPAVLISISHFPATGRPQAGLSFAPLVYEISITEGATRFLAIFHGAFPEPEIPASGGCPVRTGAFVQTQTVLGNRAWLDANKNGLQDPWERGVEGLCVNLYDPAGNLLQQTTTDTNGYYGFNVAPGRYVLEFVKPGGLEFTGPNLADDSLDSDADPLTGRLEADVPSDLPSIDAGLIFSTTPTPLPDPPVYMPLAQVGPIRSGRLVYRFIADSLPNSCLIYAFASEEVLQYLPKCLMVFHQLAGGGYMLDINELRAVAEDNRSAKGSDFNYASNLFSEQVPPFGRPGSQLNVFIAYQNQSGWFYDPLYRAYLRYVDTSEYEQAGVLHADTDRLTGRQIHVENLIVLFARHDVISPTNLNIRLDPGWQGDAILFRDGQAFKIRWNSVEGRPITFVDAEGEPVPLRPGHSWVLVVTPDSTIGEEAPGEWLLRFRAPEGAQ
jgi:hypothetical protein